MYNPLASFSINPLNIKPAREIGIVPIIIRMKILEYGFLKKVFSTF